jgi:hypothetical protein
LRRIRPEWLVAVEGDGTRVTREAFQDQRAPDGTEGMSVYVEEHLVRLGLSATNVLDGHPGYGLVSLTAGVVRQLGLEIEWAPVDTDGLRGQAHYHVIGKKTGAVRRQLASACQIRVSPPTP